MQLDAERDQGARHATGAASRGDERQYHTGGCLIDGEAASANEAPRNGAAVGSQGQGTI